jgi:hypothetical protein
MYEESLNESNISGNQERYQIASQLAEQKYQMEALGEILQVILTNLRQQPNSPDSQKQLRTIQALLVDMDSKTNGRRYSQQELHADITKRLNAIEQENEDLNKSCLTIRQQLKNQQVFLDNNLGIPALIAGFVGVALIASFTTVTALQLFPQPSKQSQPKPPANPLNLSANQALH